MENITQHAPDEELPEITATQSWCCENGCGETTPVQTEFEYWSARDAETGALIQRRIGKVWVSKCCEAALELYDDAANEGRGDVISWTAKNADQLN